jgi:hypothetical protein
VADWQTISSLATAGGTLVLALATFSAVRSSNRSARIAEEALLTGMRPLLLPSLGDSPPQKVSWIDGHAVRLPGGRAVVEAVGDVVYLAISVRNVGPGIALFHGWYPMAERSLADPVDAADFRRLTIDLYVAAGGIGYWEGAIREPDDPVGPGLLATVRDRTPFTIDLLYGDQAGGQRTISRFSLLPAGDEGWYSQAARHWNLDRPAPRQ